jgi:hypothetical protein
MVRVAAIVVAAPALMAARFVKVLDRFLRKHGY